MSTFHTILYLSLNFQECTVKSTRYCNTLVPAASSVDQGLGKEIIGGDGQYTASVNLVSHGYTAKDRGYVIHN